jgi:hypothetical protein
MRTRSLLAPLSVLILAACSSSPAAPSEAWTHAAPASGVETELVVEVYKSPTCACCHE